MVWICRCSTCIKLPPSPSTTVLPGRGRQRRACGAPLHRGRAHRRLCSSRPWPTRSWANWSYPRGWSAARVTAGEPLVNARTGEPEKGSVPSPSSARSRWTPTASDAGDIGAVAKAGDCQNWRHPVRRFPCGEATPPLRSRAVQPVHGRVTVAKKGDEGKISSALPA